MAIFENCVTISAENQIRRLYTLACREALGER